MKSTFFYILFLFVGLSCYAQHTERYKGLMSELSTGNTIVDTTYYNNGQIRYIGQRTSYIFKDEEYQTWTGVGILFYRNNVIARISIKDMYGNYLNEKFYDKSGKLIEERITTKIDNRSKNLREYFDNIQFNESSLGDIEKTINYYKYSKKSKKRFLYKKEYIKLTNQILNETLVFINKNGDVIKTKVRKARNI